LEGSQYRGEAFERQIAYILQDAEFEIESLEPRPVIRGGTKIGDIDIVAKDPATNARIAVSCKEWFFTPPGANEFAKFIVMLEMEGFRFGIMASASSFRDSVLPMLEHYQNQGFSIGLLDGGVLQTLHELKIRNDRLALKQMVRDMLGLPLPPSVSPQVSGSTEDFISFTVRPQPQYSPQPPPAATPPAVPQQPARVALPFILRPRETLLKSTYASCFYLRGQGGYDLPVGNQVYLTNRRVVVVNERAGFFSRKTEIAAEIPLNEVSTVNQMVRGVLRKEYLVIIPFSRYRTQYELAFVVSNEWEISEWRNVIERAIRLG